MPKDISITQARQEITALPERLAKDPGAVAVTRRGKPVLAIMPWEHYESIMETLEILSDEEQMKALRISIIEAQQGDLVSWDTVKKRLDL